MKSNLEKIHNYLVGDKAPYLFEPTNNGKIIMLSGKWGSGKTHFWKHQIEEKLKGKGTPNYYYLSLYGKQSIEEIENEILLGLSTKEGSGLKKLFDGGLKWFPKGLRTLKLDFHGIGIDTGVASKEIEKSEWYQAIKSGVKNIKEGTLICFDDFERKSSQIDLRDLFGFITHLSEDLKLKIVVILNSEAFSGNDKKIFKEVKEKTISKHLKFQPNKIELFRIMLTPYLLGEQPSSLWNSVIECINTADESNARIYRQVIENVMEYSNYEDGNISQKIKALVFSTIIYSTFNRTFLAIKKENKVQSGFNFINSMPDLIKSKYVNLKTDSYSKEELKGFLANLLTNAQRAMPGQAAAMEHDLKVLENEIEGIWCVYLLEKKFMVFDGVDFESLNKINDFVESGILM